MDDTIRTGIYLKMLLTEKKVSLSVLAEQMGFKSRSTLYRLLSGGGLTPNQRRLVLDIAEHVDFTEEEKQRLRALMSAETTPFLSQCGRTLQPLFDENWERNVYHDFIWSGERLRSIAGRSGGSVRMYVYGGMPFAVLNVLCDIIPEIPITHFIQLRKSAVSSAEEIMAVIMLAEYDDYASVITDRVDFNGIVMLSKDDSGKADLYVLDITDRNDLSEYTSRISDEMYGALTCKYEKRRTVSEPVKHPVSTVKDYIASMQKAVLMDESDMYLFEGAPCFGYLSFDILYELFKTSGFFGFPEEHPYIQELIRLFRTRQAYLEDSTAAKKFMVFDVRKIRQMMLTGYAFNHEPGMMPMSKRQMRKYFNSLIDMAQQPVPRIRFRFLRDFSIRFPFVYGCGSVLYIGRTGSFEYRLDKSAVHEIMSYYKDVVWDSYTLSDHESIRLLREMMDQYLG